MGKAKSKDTALAERLKKSVKEGRKGEGSKESGRGPKNPIVERIRNEVATGDKESKISEETLAKITDAPSKLSSDEDTSEIIILDDNFYIRFVLRHLVAYLMRYGGEKYSIYTSEDGIQGLGYVMVTTPKVVIIDTTLPKYSGKEVIDFLLSNERLMSSDLTVIALTDNLSPQSDEDQDDRIYFLNKHSKTFIEEFVEYIDRSVLDGQSLQIAPGYDRVMHMATKSVRSAAILDNTADEVLNIKPFFKVFRSFRWIAKYLSLNRSIMWLYLLTPRTIDDNIKQQQVDLQKYRVRSYSAVVITLIALGFLVVQLVLVWLGKGFLGL